MDAGASQSDQHITLFNMLADQDVVQEHCPDARRREIKGITVADPLDHLADLRQFAASDGNVRLLRPLIQPFPSCSKRRASGLCTAR